MTKNDLNHSPAFFRLVLPAFLLLMAMTVSSYAQTCQTVWAQNVLGHNDGSNQDSNHDNPADVLNDTPSTYFSLGKWGNVAVDFGANFTTSGDSAPDICVRELNENDCYYICLFPANSATAQKLLAAGMTAGNNGYYEFNMTFCGDYDLDLDSLVPGYNAGELEFSNVLILDDGSSGDGAEIEQICALICNNVPPTPSIGCELIWAQSVLGHNDGSNQDSSNDDPTDVLGDTPNTRFSLGRSGNVLVEFGANFTTSGDSGADICVREWNSNDCYYVCLFPADAATASKLLAAGMSENNGFYEFNMTFCGDLDLDLDNLVPGYAEGELQFLKVLILDDGSSGNGAEIEQICALVCTPSTNCVETFATTVDSFTVGNNPNGNGLAQGNILGDTASTYLSMGDGGEVKLSFGVAFNNSGDDTADLKIDEFGVSDCYTVLLEPASAATTLAMTEAGLVAVGSAFQLPTVYCGDNDIDLDIIIPGYSEGQLLFNTVTLVDDSSGGDGAEINRVSVLVCDGEDSALAELGDCVFVDENCDGILDQGEGGKQHVTVSLIRQSDGQVVDSKMTGADGKYRFTHIIPGDYFVSFAYNEVSYFATLPNVGNDDTIDSDVDPQTNFVAVTLAAGDVDETVDFGVCVICVGEEATKISLPCGYDPINDPVVDATLLIPGDPITFTFSSNAPNSLGWIYYSFGVFPKVPYAGCNFYIDVLNPSTNLGIVTIMPTDANGGFTYTTPTVVPPGVDGFTVVFQSRVCAPQGIPGPFAPLPDFFGNGLIMTIGCP